MPLAPMCLTFAWAWVFPGSSRLPSLTQAAPSQLETKTLFYHLLSFFFQSSFFCLPRFGTANGNLRILWVISCSGPTLPLSSSRSSERKSKMPNVDHYDVLAQETWRAAMSTIVEESYYRL